MLSHNFLSIQRAPFMLLVEPPLVQLLLNAKKA